MMVRIRQERRVQGEPWKPSRQRLATANHARGGFALVTVILVLAALLVLCTPFMMTARNADQASTQMFDRAQARIALDSAAVHALAKLEQSHFSLDQTRYWDSAEELHVDNRFADGFYNANDAQGVMWDLDVTDLAGQIDLGSAPPQLIGRMIGAATRLVRPLEKNDKTLPVSNTAGFDPEGYLYLNGELIHYGAIAGNEFVELERGLGVNYDSEDNVLPGPRPPGDYGVGAGVIDQRAFALATWRMQEAGGVRDFDSVEQLRELDEFVFADEGLGSEARHLMIENGTVYGGVGAGDRWQRAARLTRRAERERTGTIFVDDVRYFNSGSTIRITDGETTETALVIDANPNGQLTLDRGLKSDYQAYEGVVSVLARRPVNINTASANVLKLLFTGLSWNGRNERITESEAGALAEVVVQSRPFDGMQDFLKRVVLPAAGVAQLPSDATSVPDALAQGDGIISPWDALALYSNALNANDVMLSASSMPFCFSSRDVYELDLRAAVNAPSGVERYSLVREDVVSVVPQEQLLHLWTRQEDFDEALRLGRTAPWFMTGPEPTSREGSGTVPPSRLWAHIGTYSGEPALDGVGQPVFSGGTGTLMTGVTGIQVFAGRGEEGYAQLWPSRVENSFQGQNVYIMHFPHELRDPEGRWLPDETIARTPDHADIEWTGGTGLLRGITFSGWIKPSSLADAAMMDVGGSSNEADRLALLYEGGDLVLRLMDGGGDHRDTTMKEYVELRYALNEGDGPGMPVNTWSHVFVDVRGARPSQMTMMINGTARGVRTPGLTHLTGAVSDTDTFLAVDSVEGFPQRGVVRIGNELIEYVLNGNGLNCQHNTTGPDAGFGGRNARVRWVGGSNAVPANIGTVDLSHAQNTPVELYGYSLELVSDLPAGSSTLAGDIGAFRVAQVTGVEGGSTGLGDPIVVLAAGFVPLTAFGMEGLSSGVTGLILAPGDDETMDPAAAKTMEAFSPQGGYAAIVQVRWTAQAIGNGQEPIRTAENTVPGGVEVFRYSGWSGNTLNIAARGHIAGLPNVPTADDQGDVGGTRAFITDWANITAGGVSPNTLLDWQTFVVPISIPAPGGGQSFLVPQPLAITMPAAGGGGGNGPEILLLSVPEFAQITREDMPELTEWIAYDEYVGGHLVRDAADVMQNIYNILNFPGSADPADARPEGAGGGTGGGGIGGGGGGIGGGNQIFELITSSVEPTALVPPVPAPAAQQSGTGLYWEPTLGVPGDAELPLTRAVREGMLFRGVMGTHSNAHPSGSRIVPVFHARYDDNNPDSGRPGRYDSAFIMGAEFDHLGWPVQVHRAHRPSTQFPFHDWVQQAPGNMVAVTQAAEVMRGPNVGFGQEHLYVALTDACPQPMTAGSIDPTGQAQVEDTRAITRIAKFPSGERPRDVANLGVGSGFQKGSGSIMSATIDEVFFAHPEFGMNTPSADPEAMQGASMVLREEFTMNGNQLLVWPNSIRIPRGQRGSTLDFLTTWNQDAGLVKVGNEILCYENLDADQGVITIAPNGWGLLGSDPQSHAAGEAVTWLEHWPISVLTGPIGAAESVIRVSSTDEFPPQGTVRIGDELIHYTRLRNGALEMPRASKEPGKMDEQGAGIFRGRYGTPPTGHLAGEPVILFPFRYWDRWADQADAPEMAYFEFELDQPAAWWESVFWTIEDSGHPSVRFRVLQRTDPDVPWDADPETTDGLDLLDDGLIEGAPIPIGVQSDRIEWRVFVQYLPGAFDPLNSAAHGWRSTPKLEQIGAFYVAPEFVLRSLEQ